MLLSKSCVYGLRATLYLASKDRNDFTPINQMSKKLEISFQFLTKILQQLTADVYWNRLKARMAEFG